MIPTRRDFQFSFNPKTLPTWLNGSRHGSHFFNALSVLFPRSERFMIRSVRHYRDNGQIDDAALLAQVTAFIGQEATHSREHEGYNAAMAAAGYDLDRMLWLGGWIMDAGERHLPPRWRLSCAVAMEHLTAIMSDGALRRAEMFDNADSILAAAWLWHMLEETEHKSVAFDVMRVTQPGGPAGYLRRVTSLALVTAILTPISVGNYCHVLRADGELTRLAGWLELYRLLLGRDGAFDSLLSDWMSYFRPGFHPWQHDNSHFLAQIPILAREHGRAA